MVVELNRRLVKGYTHYKDDPRIINLKKSVNAYNKQLWLLGVRDHQVEYAKFSIPKVVFTLIYRLAKLAIMAIGTLPGTTLFAPIFIAGKIISIKKSREALAASTVKLEGRDVMATWKLLVALALAPVLNTIYTALLTWWTYYNRVQGYIPEWVPLWTVLAFGVVFFPSITFAALRFGETGMDIVKSLRPLVLSLNPSSANTLVRLRETRRTLSAEVTDLINTLGPEVFPDFDVNRIVADPSREGVKHEPKSPPRTARADGDTASNGVLPSSPPHSNTTDASIGRASAEDGHLPRNESFKNLSSVELFATLPPSRSRSRSRSRSNSSGGWGVSAGFPLKAFSSINSKASLDEVSKKIRGAMRARGEERSRRRYSNGGTELASSGATTPDSEEGKKEV